MPFDTSVKLKSPIRSDKATYVRVKPGSLAATCCVTCVAHAPLVLFFVFCVFYASNVAR